MDASENVVNQKRERWRLRLLQFVAHCFGIGYEKTLFVFGFFHFLSWLGFDDDDDL